MTVKLDDAQIQALLAERKPLPAGYLSRLTMKPKRGHREQELAVAGDQGSDFRLILRQSQINPHDFSVILGYRLPESNQLFRLTRYNGRSHWHTNTLEGETFFDFHIHTATERYQQSGLREDTYASLTTHYSDFHGAMTQMIQDLFDAPVDPQTSLFN